MYLRLQGLNKAFGDRQVVRDLDLALDKGEILCLLGSSGCGKTTTLKIIAGLLEADAGSVFIEGRDITNLPPEERPVTTVFQNYALFPNMTVLKNVTYGLRLRGMPREQRLAMGMEYLEIAGLAEYADARINEISGGQQQRVALMRSLVLRPKVLLLDEPLSNLDAKLREKMRAELKELRDRFDLTMVFVTHDRDEAMTIASRVAVMQDGQILQIGAPEELYCKPNSMYVMDFLGEVNTLRGEGGEELHIRPEDLRIDESGPIVGRIAGCDFHGFYRRYAVELDGTTVSVLASKEQRRAVGDTVRLSVSDGPL